VPKKKIQNKNKKTHRKKTAVIPSITAQTQGPQLKRALSRHKSRKAKTDLFDHALPISAQFIGVLNAHGSHSRPDIQFANEHTLSPFVLSLKPHHILSPEQLLEEEWIPAYRVNLLNGQIGSVQQAESYSPTPFIQQDPIADLKLSAEELREQLTKELVREQGWTRLSLPIKSQTIQESSQKNRTKIFQPDESKHFEAFSSDSFIPSQMPDDIFAYFDLPEEEEQKEPESNIVTLDALEHEVLEFTDEEDWLDESTPTKRFSINWKTLLVLPGGWQRTIVSFVLLSFAIVLPLHAMNIVQELRETKTELEVTGQAAVTLLSSGADAALDRNTAVAAASFSKAGAEFDNASQTIDELGLGAATILSALPVTGDDFRTGKALIKAGEELAIAGERIAEGMNAAENELDPTPTSRLAILNIYLESALPHLHAAEQAIEDIDGAILPTNYQTTFDTLQSQLPNLITSVEDFISFYEVINVVLGGEGVMRYLLIFQNNTEIRPTGGFIGSFAELKVRNGEIEELTVPGGGSYDLQGSMRTNFAAPEPLQILKSEWEFQDGNWFPDFPTSARQLLQFYENAGGPSVDGVVAVNATYVANLIGLLGSIQMPEYNRTIDEENFIFEAQRIVELEYDKEENKPKAFIGDLAPKLMDKALEKTSEDFLDILSFAEQGLLSRDVQFYFTNDDIQRKVLERGWGGSMIQTDGDYLMVVDTNLGGGKTDGVIEEDIQMDVTIAEDGSITNTVSITRTHHGIQGLLFTGVNNVDYLRVYVPKGSELISASGFTVPDTTLFDRPEKGWTIDDDLIYMALSEDVDAATGTKITEEHGKTVFGNWVQTKPGSSSTATFTYTLPFTLEMLSSEPTLMEKIQDFVGIPSTDQYSLTVQKQSGILDRTTNVTFTTPSNINPIWTSHKDEITFSNATDGFFATLFEEQP
jgi:hypothetical protein